MTFFPSNVLVSAAPLPSPVEWEETPCLLCGGRNWSPLLEAQDLRVGGSGCWFRVVQCQDCGLCFTNPRPSPRSIGQFYPQDYWTRPGWRARGRRSRGWSSWRRGWPERTHLEVQGKGRLLDFGCGAGSFLERMRRQGWQVTGIDVSPRAVELVRRGLGLPAVIGSLPHPDFAPASFDVITMWHSLEHVHQPLAVLRAARQLLAPGGRLLVAVPNIDSLPFRWFRAAWFGLDLPRHLIHFSPWTLQAMLEKGGFRPGPVRHVRQASWLRSSARLACAMGHGPNWLRWLRRRPLAGVASWYSCYARQSDCLFVTAVADTTHAVAVG
ncbi:MAG: class I SAM-dependent methyltransferase [Gemmataceae bacterium]|nr:class I SAM-dependent methyltransferase [Gemmataceae bacterium]MDW8265163.1 class I SAM-dependent methyltransferase [Gemmataceae bacterium]